MIRKPDKWVIFLILLGYNVMCTDEEYKISQKIRSKFYFWKK